MTGAPRCLFVYGTLRRGSGHPMQRWLETRSRWIGEASVAGRLIMLDGYPGLLLEDSPNGVVRGDVLVLVDDSTLAAVDAYEGYAPRGDDSDEYERVRAEASMDDGTTLDVWLYVYRGDVGGRAPIASGDYVRFLHQRE